MAEEKKSVKELLEFVAGLKELGLLVRAALKDGKVDLSDLSLLGQVLTKQQVFVDAFSGLGELGAEAKDIDIEEAILVVRALLDAAKDVKDA